MGCSFDYFSMIRSLEMKEWYPFFLVCIPTEFGGCMPSTHATKSRDMQKWYCSRPGWERCAIALARPCTHHIKNTRAVCRTPKTLYGVLSQLFLIHSFSTLLTTLFLISLVKLIYSTFYLLFFVHTVTSSFSCCCHLLNPLTHS